MSTFGPEFDRMARRLGWELSPDMGAAERAVRQRAAKLAAARPRQRSAPIRVVLVATLTVTAVLAATPALITRFGVIDRPRVGPATAGQATARPDTINSISSAGLPDSFIDVPVVGVPGAHALRGDLHVMSCARQDVTLETEFRREVYPPGDAAVVTLVLRNTSPTACSAVADRCASRISVFDAGGAGVYSSVARRYLCQAPGQAGPAEALRQILQPGQAMTMTFKWPGQSCSGPAPGPGCGLAAPGRYTVTGDWAGFPTADSGPTILSPDYRLTTLPRHITIA